MQICSSSASAHPGQQGMHSTAGAMSLLEAKPIESACAVHAWTSVCLSQRQRSKRSHACCFFQTMLHLKQLV